MNEESQTTVGVVDQVPARLPRKPWYRYLIEIVVVVFAIYGAWSFYDQYSNQDSSDAVTTNITGESVTTSASNQQANSITADEGSDDVTAGWKTFSAKGFSVKYPSNWTTKEYGGMNYDLSIISLTSPETAVIIEQQKKASVDGQNYGPYTSDIDIYYYPTVADETENKSNGYGATTLEQLVQVGDTIQKTGDSILGGRPAVDVIWGGESANLAVLAVNNNHLYKVWFQTHVKRSELTEVENLILDSFTFTD